MTEKELESQHHSKLYEIALKCNPGNKESIDRAYNFLKEIDSLKLKQLFISYHIRPYFKRQSLS